MPKKSGYENYKIWEYAIEYIKQNHLSEMENCVGTRLGGSEIYSFWG